jgi:hypothetical protein
VALPSDLRLVASCGGRPLQVPSLQVQPGGRLLLELELPPASELRSSVVQLLLASDATAAVYCAPAYLLVGSPQLAAELQGAVALGQQPLGCSDSGGGSSSSPPAEAGEVLVGELAQDAASVALLVEAAAGSGASAAAQALAGPMLDLLAELGRRGLLETAAWLLARWQAAGLDPGPLLPEEIISGSGDTGSQQQEAAEQLQQDDAPAGSSPACGSSSDTAATHEVCSGSGADSPAEAAASRPPQLRGRWGVLLRGFQDPAVEADYLLWKNRRCIGHDVVSGILTALIVLTLVLSVRRAGIRSTSMQGLAVLSPCCINLVRYLVLPLAPRWYLRHREALVAGFGATHRLMLAASNAGMLLLYGIDVSACVSNYLWIYCIWAFTSAAMQRIRLLPGLVLGAIQAAGVGAYCAARLGSALPGLLVGLGCLASDVLTMVRLDEGHRASFLATSQAARGGSGAERLLGGAVAGAKVLAAKGGAS